MSIAMNNILTYLVLIFALDGGQNPIMDVSVKQRKDVLMIEFENKQEVIVQVPNYYRNSKDSKGGMRILLDSVVSSQGDTLVLKTHHTDTIDLNKTKLEDTDLRISHNQIGGLLVRSQGVVDVNPGKKYRQVLKLPVLFAGNRYKYYLVLFDNVELASGKMGKWE